MRSLKLQVQMSIDGYMAGPDGEMDWLVGPWTSDIEQYVEALTDPVDTILLGRKLAEGFIPAWASEPESESAAAIEKMNETPKVVVSTSLERSPWPNATVAGGDLEAVVAELKAGTGGDIIAYGGSTLFTSLLAAQLVDDLFLFVNPHATGGGLPVFPPGAPRGFTTVEAQGFDCGISVLHLRPAR